ncbi:MAG TPA: undecaprenyl-diphosphate phosphatase [Planctomycetota bacterium]
MLLPLALAAAPALGALLVLAVIQGVSEFLPISSDGHLVLAQQLMALPGPHLAIDVALHMGTLGAVLLVFRGEAWSVVTRARAGERRELLLLVVGSLPAAVVGLGFADQVEGLFSSTRAAAVGLVVTALFLWFGERARTRAGGAPARALGWRDALWIGCAQALAILPGVSRSGSTIATAFVRGVAAPEAARFSFLLSIPAVSGAVMLKVPELVRAGQFGGELLLAVAVTFAVGVLALRVLLAFLGRGAFRWCALYCALLGGVTLALS